MKEERGNSLRRKAPALVISRPPQRGDKDTRYARYQPSPSPTEHGAAHRLVFYPEHVQACKHPGRIPNKKQPCIRKVVPSGLARGHEKLLGRVELLTSSLPMTRSTN